MARRFDPLSLARNGYWLSGIVVILLTMLFAVLLTFVPPLVSLPAGGWRIFAFIFCALLVFLLLGITLKSILESSLRPERLAYQQIADRYGQQLWQTADLSQLIQMVSHSLYETLNAESISVWIYHGQASILSLSHVEGTMKGGELAEGLPVDLDIDQLQGTQLVSNLPESALRQIWMELDIQIIGAMQWRGDLIGTIGVGKHRLMRAHSQDTVRLLTWMAGQLALVVNNARLTAELEETLNHLQVAYRQTIEVQELERRNLAAELHDDILGRLTTMGLTLRNSRKRLTSDPEQVNTWLETLEQETRAVNHRLREITQGLHPSVLTDLGLISATQAYLDSLSRQSLLPTAPHTITLTAQGFAKERIPDQKLERDLYHITRQALDNAVAHAHAGQVFIHLRWGKETMSVTIQDTGKGMKDIPETLMGQNGRLGLLSMHERVRAWGGRLTFDTSQGQGTTVHAVFPIGQASQAPTQLQAYVHHLAQPALDEQATNEA